MPGRSSLPPAPLRNAGAPVNQIIAVDATHEVHWGVWNGTADPVLDLIDPADPVRVLPIPERVLWATVLPTRPDVLAARTDKVTLNTVMGAVTMDVDFAAARIFNGNLGLEAASDYWWLEFEGDIRGSFADLRLLPGSRVNGNNAVDGVMGGVFTGRNGEALLQVFDLKDASDPGRWAQGMLLVK